MKYALPLLLILCVVVGMFMGSRQDQFAGSETSYSAEKGLDGALQTEIPVFLPSQVAREHDLGEPGQGRKWYLSTSATYQEVEKFYDGVFDRKTEKHHLGGEVAYVRNLKDGTEVQVVLLREGTYPEMRFTVQDKR